MNELMNELLWPTIGMLNIEQGYICLQIKNGIVMEIITQV